MRQPTVNFGFATKMILLRRELLVLHISTGDQPLHRVPEQSVPTTPCPAPRRTPAHDVSQVKDLVGDLPRLAEHHSAIEKRLHLLGK